MKKWSVVFRLKVVLIGFGLILLGIPVLSQPETVQQLKQELQLPKSDSVRTSIYLDLGSAYIHINLDSAQFYYRKGITVAQKIANRYLLRKSYLRLGISYEGIGDYSRGISALRAAERVASVFPKDSNTMGIQVRLTRAYRGLGDYQKALQVGLAIEKYYEKHPEQRDMSTATLYSELAVIYKDLHMNDLALTYLLKRREFSEKINCGQAVAYGNLADYYISIKNFPKAETWIRRTIKIDRVANLPQSMGEDLQMLGQIMIGFHRYTKAIVYLNQALVLQKKVGSTEYIASIYSDLANCYLALGKMDQALVSIYKAIALFQTIHSAKYTQGALEIYSDILQKGGHYQQALQVTQKAVTLKDSLFGLEKQKAIARIQSNYDLDRKQTQILALKKDLTIQQQAKQTVQLELTLAKLQRFYLLITTSLLVFLMVFIIFSYRKQKKARLLLQKQKNEIMDQREQLAEINQTKDKLFSLIGHDLRSSVATLKRDVQQLKLALSATQLSALQLVTQLDQRLDTVLDLLTNVLAWSYIQLKGGQTLLQPIDLQDSLLQAISLFSVQLHQKQLTLLNHVNPHTMVLADKQQLDIVFHNVLGNALKFTPDQGAIRLFTINHDNQLELQIRDTGIGMSEAQVAHLFTSPDVRPGLKGEVGTGLGIRLCLDMLTKLGGKLRVESKVSKGTTVRIWLPTLDNPAETDSLTTGV